MSELLNTFGAVASGGITGILGTVFGRVAGFFETKQKNAHDLKLLDFKQKQNSHDLTLQEREFSHERDMLEMNIEAHARETEQEIALINQKGSWAGIAASYAHDTAIGKASLWVINVLRLVRPLLTVMLLLLIPICHKLGLPVEILNAIIFAATGAVFWWFGDRAPRNTGLSQHGATNV